MPNILLPAGDYTPDLSPYLNSGMTVTAGVYPRSDGSDGPLLSPTSASVALGSRCLGAFASRDKGGTSYVVSGTAAALAVQTNLSWTDKSGTTYAVPANQHWRFTQFGEQIIATNSADPIQTWTMGNVGNFANLSSGAPLARYVATIEPGFCMVGFYTSGGTTVSSGLWWSALNDATSWPTPGTLAATSVQSDVQQMPGGGFITGILPAIGGANGVVFTERTLYRIEYVGAPAVFAFREIDRSRGCIAPQGLIQVGPTAFFLSEDGFCAFNGTSATNIGAGRVDRKFWSEVDQTALDRIYATVDLDRKLVIWAYPTNSALNQNPNRWLIYSYSKDKWRYADDAALTVEYLYPGRTTAYTLDTLDNVLPGGPDNSNGFTVDNAFYQGGRRALVGFDASHSMVSYTGNNLAARVETGDVDADGSRVFVTGITPLTDAVAPTACVGWRGNLSDSITYTTPTAPGYDNRCPQRISAQYARAALVIPAGASWSYLQGARVEYMPDGER